MGTHQTQLAPASVRSVLNYLQDTGVRPVNYTYPPPDGVDQRSGVLDPTQVTIHNARLLDEPASINRQGFEKSITPAPLRTLKTTNKCACITTRKPKPYSNNRPAP